MANSWRERIVNVRSNVLLLWKGEMYLGMIIMLVVYLFLGIYVVKVGIDNSKNSQHTKEILSELREIKELLKEQR
ncbi:hypothetical protein [Paenibacillus sp. FSL R5-0473]|uniref:hypothetical protein n=1 Tax=Paenibacillus sp. FSL R5-0473 TaxID=2921642 RepID=UPI0030F60C55